MTSDYRYKRGITFLEKPVTQDERAIASVLEKLYSARQKRNVEEIVSLYEKGAKVHICSPRKELTLEQYKAFLNKNIANLISTYFDQTIIRVKSPGESLVSAVAFYQCQDHTVGPAPILFVFSKIDSKWLIIQSEWL